MQARRIFLGVAVGWLALSIAGAAYFIYAQRSFEPSPKSGPLPVQQLPPRAANLPRLDPELLAMLYRYYPKPVSEGFEELFIRDYFQDRRGGFLLDVGASDYREYSTTHYLDVALGWHGIAIDAIAEFAGDYAVHRPRTKYFPVFVSDRSDDHVDFRINTRNSTQSSADVGAAEKFKDATEIRELSTVTLNDLLDSQGVEAIDLLSMDIELWEPKALAGFAIERFRPKLVVIEFHPPVRHELEAYFEQHGYVQIEKYTKWDSRNAYYVPAGDLAAFLARPPLN